MILSASFHIAEGDAAWTGTTEVGDPASYQRMAIDDPITLDVGGETCALIVDSKTLSRDGIARPRLQVALISPTAMLASPRALPIDQVWNTATWARDAAEGVSGQSIQWDMVNWMIPGGRLAVHGASPLDVVRTIAEAAGGVVETRMDGILRVRHRFPVPVPEWGSATPDHILTDASDNLSCHESYTYKDRVNQVLVRGYQQSSQGHLSVELDTRPDGLNRGKTSFRVGDTAKMITFLGYGTSINEAIVTSGSIFKDGWTNVWISEDIVFSQTDTASLGKPAIGGMDRVIWMGEDLGGLTVQSDRVTVVSDRSGFSIARVRYLARALAWNITVQEALDGNNEFPVQALFHATHIEDQGWHNGAIICQRGDGAFRGPDISVPLLAGEEPMRSRGRAELDAGEILQKITIVCIHRPGVMPGQLVEVHDAMMGASWRGKITGVSHTADGKKLTTQLDILRNVPTFS
ncbi:MAG: hypothetical protein HQL73_02710 [Magnetococcales bacterium]|nr:hypothetical protein [Magnetococcales bacterium]